MKRNISVILLIAMVISITPQIAIAQEEQTLAYAKETEFLTLAGILDSSFNPDEILTRSGLTLMVIKTIYPDLDFSKSLSNEPCFRDVDTGHAHYAYIKACKDLGIISGDQFGYFYPDDEVTLTEALAIIVNSLGYSLYAQAQGGYPSGYFKVAKDIGLTKGMNQGQNEAVTKAVAAKILYNSLFASLVVIDSITNSEVNVRKDGSTNLLAERLGIYEYDVIVADNGITSIVGDSMYDPQRVVLQQTASEKFMHVYAADSDIGEYLGTRLNVYIRSNRETARDEVVHFNVHSAVREKEIGISTVLRVNNNYIEYETDKNSGKIERARIDYPMMVLNGVVVNESLEGYLTGKDGVIRLVDNDGNGGYEFLDILSFNSYGTHTLSEKTRNIVTDKANAEGGYLYCRFNPTANLNLDPSLADYKFVRSGDIKSLSQLSANNIVSIAESPDPINGKKFYFLAVSTDKAEGVLESISTSENEITVGGITYPVSASLTSVKEKYIERLRLNDNITIYLDVTGKVAYTVGGTRNNKNYAYMIDAALGTGLDEGVMVKLFLQDGTINKLTLSDKATIDGTTAAIQGGETLYQAQLRELKERHPVSGGAAFLGGATNARPVSIELNASGLITSIDTDTPNHAAATAHIPYPSAGGSYYNPYYSQSTIKYSNEEIEDDKALKAGFRTARITEYMAESRTFEGNFYISADTVVMNVPDIDTYALSAFRETYPNQTSTTNRTFEADLIKLFENSKQEKNYKILSANSLNSMYVYDAQAYDVDPDTGVAALVVLRGTTKSPLYGAVPYRSGMMSAFLRKTEVYDPERDGKVYRIYHTQDGEAEQSVLVEMEDLLWNYRVIIDGCAASYTPYRKTVTPLSTGDIIRIFSEGGWLTHIERIWRAEHIVEECQATTMFPQNLRVPYSTTMAGGTGGVGESYSMPFDVRNQAWYSFYESYTLGAFYVRKASGNTLACIAGLGRLNAIDLSSTTTYTDQYIPASITSIPVIEIRKDEAASISAGRTVKTVTVRKGNLTDIITTETADGLTGASLFLFKMTAYSVEQAFILNDLSE